MSDLRERSDLLSHFRITAKLGEGGMGQVYRAEDTKLGREVAIKVLPEAVASDPERLARFEREARVLAALDHPHIAAIYGLEEADGRKLLIMQLAEGETLAERIARAPIPLDEAAPIALQIAEALEAAHEKGIIHRDLKPANVKVTPEGQVKVLDFGLAKALDVEPASGGGQLLTQSPTLTGQMTSAGVLLGTAAYMSPEQARGRPVDRRADNWAFGVLLFEMLTGEGPFAGETVSDMLAAVLTREVELGNLPAGTPRHIRWLLDRCLERDPGLRLRDIGEARICLATEISPPGPAEPSRSERRRHSGLVAGALTVAALIAGLLLGLWLAPSSPPAGLRKVDIVMPDQLLFFQAPPLLAPDGSAILLANEEGLHVRRLDRVENRLIPGTAETLYSTWAPDSREIAFVTRGRLWRAALDGQSPVPIAALPEELAGGGGIVWTHDDRILLAGSPRSGLMEVSARGGTVREAVPLDPETERDFHEISALPEGRGFLISVHPQGGISSRIDVLSNGERRTVLDLEGGWVENPAYSPPGYILFSKGSASAPELWAVPFSLDRLQATGEPFLVAPTGATPSVSEDGMLSYVRGRRLVFRQPLRLDREGRIEMELARPIPGARAPAVSPDGTRLVASVVDAETYDLRLFDIATRTASRLTSGLGVDFLPAWSPDGGRIAYSISDRDLVAVVSVDPPHEPRTLTRGWGPRWLPDGKSLVFQRLGDGATWDIWRYWLEAEAEEPVLEGPSHERSPVPSPDGHWLAYTSDETGQEELFVSGFPGGERVQVSHRGATEPQWISPDELLFRSGSQLYFTRRLGSDRLAFEEPRLLLSLAEAGLSSGDSVWNTTPDGGLVVLRDVVPEDAAVLTLVTNWSLEFQQER
jgi:serine/threonine-protein kinase